MPVETLRAYIVWLHKQKPGTSKLPVLSLPLTLTELGRYSKDLALAAEQGKVVSFTQGEQVYYLAI